MVSMPSWPIPPWQQVIKYDLDRISRLAHALGNVHLKLPPVIHIAGTNGKGSSCAMLKSIFEAASYKVHMYTSPHLLAFNERIILAGEKISDQYLFEVCQKAKIASDSLGIEPSFFEGTTAAAFLAFSSVDADVLILETGLGGRLDATNIVPNPLLTLITPISYDHMECLGPTLQIIAAEKAGIIKKNVSCVISAQVDEVYDVLLAKCEDIGAKSFCYEYDYGLDKTDTGFFYKSKNYNNEFNFPALLGDHQLVNAAGVISAVNIIDKQFNISTHHIIQGLQNVRWPARIEKINAAKYQKLANEKVQIWVDGAHNTGGAQVLANFIRQHFAHKVYFIFGMTKNRNIEDFCSYFKDLIEIGYGVRVLSEPSSYSPEIVSQRATSVGINVYPADSLEDAIQTIAKHANVENIDIIICGSLFLAADFLKLIS